VFENRMLGEYLDLRERMWQEAGENIVMRISVICCCTSDIIISASRPALGPTQPPVQWVPGALSPWVKRGRGVMLTTHPLPVVRLRRSRNYTSCPAHLWSVTGPLYLLTPDIIGMINSRWIRWAGHVTHGVGEMSTELLFEKLKGSDHPED
jgi:hypothetical protein